MAEEQSIFRKQSIDSVSSPEQLNDYIKTESPSVWFIMTAVILLLVGVCIWGLFGHLDTKVTVGGISSGGTLTLIFPEDSSEKIKKDMKVIVDNSEYTILSVENNPFKLTDKFDEYALHLSGLDVGSFGFTAQVQTDLPDGTYKAVVIIESVSPMSFIMN